MKRESPFKNIPSQFELIPDGVPVAFISYSWDSKEHKDWVLKLSADLREKFRVYTLLDQYNRGGQDLITFMKNGLKRADRVLIVGTPKYKKKIEKTSGGAKFEDQVITVELYQRMDSTKFIPILRDGSFSESFSNLIQLRAGYDMSNDALYEKRLQELAADLWGMPINIAPALGPKPNFTPATQVLQPLNAESPKDFATIVKNYLLDPTKRIVLTEFLEEEIDKAFAKILEHASYDKVTTPQIFDSYLSIHIGAVENLLSAMLPIVRYGTLEQQKILVEAMSKFCVKPFRNGEMIANGSEYVHLLAATFLFHATGLTAVKYGKFDLVDIMVHAKVLAPNALSISSPFSLQFLAGCNHWPHETLNYYLGANWLYPYSQLIMTAIRPFFERDFIDDMDFQNSFYAWEHLASLLCGYHNNYVCPDRDWFPLGGFVNKRISLSRYEADFYTDFFMSANKLKEKWEPIKQGLFAGKYDEFEHIYQEAEKFYNANRYH